MEQKDPYSSYLEVMQKQPTSIYGLKFKPQLSDNDRDYPMKYLWGKVDHDWPAPPQEVSDCNFALCQQTVTEMGNGCRVIVEIGVNRNGDRSLTQALLKSKPAQCIYLGIDIESKSYLDDLDNNIFTIAANSHEQERLREHMAKLNIDKIDILAIDGWHSINTAVNDWMYADMLSATGIVIMHDTNIHPGPVGVFEAVDETLFEKTRHCTDYSDYGIATFKKRK